MAAGKVYFYTCIAVPTLLPVLLYATSYTWRSDPSYLIKLWGSGGRWATVRWDGKRMGHVVLGGVTVLVTGILFFLPSSTVSGEAGHLLGDYSQLLVTLAGGFCPPPTVQPTSALTERNGNTPLVLIDLHVSEIRISFLSPPP